MCERHIKKYAVIVLLSVIVLSGFSGIARGNQLTTTNTEHILRIGVVTTSFNFNYFSLITNKQARNYILAWSFEGLMGVDYDGSVYPRIAKKVIFDSSNMTATIYLRDNVTFQDGTQMTAKDVIFSYCALRQGTTFSGTLFTAPFDDNNDGTVSLQEIENHVKYVNNYEVKISTRQAYSRFFLSTLTIPIIPEHIWADHLVDANEGGSTTVNAEGYTAGVVDPSWGSSYDAMIATGPLMYAGTGAISSLIEKPYNGYWGKYIKTPDGFPLWNPGISKIIFKEFSNAQEAAYALKSGEIDCVPFNIGSSGVNLLKDDSSIKLYKNTENGYYYLAFNEKTQPANYIAFRHAVSHVIDKNTIVQRYLGGLGVAGDSPEPPLFTAWYNASVQHYPYDLNTAKDILDGYKVVAPNGFVEQDPAWGEKFPVGPSGWRTLPDGTPMQPITLFTPPADYDPVRIKVGQGIAQNLRSLGINIQAKPVDFDTLVAYMQSYNYQMLELGWALSSDPIGNLADILDPLSIQNTYGWWNASNPNPYYKNAGGVDNTLADSFSQAYATQFHKVINKALTTFNVTQQIKYTKWAQDIVTKASVVNVLYYRDTIEATSSTWSGWLTWQGTILNEFSLGRISSKGILVSPTLNVLLGGPKQIEKGQYAEYQVVAVKEDGEYVSNANVTVRALNGNATVTKYDVKTNQYGLATITLYGNSTGVGKVDVSVSDGENVVNRTLTILILGYESTLHLTVFSSKYSLVPGDTVTITAKVTNSAGNPVSGAVVSSYQNIVGYGNVTPANAYTNSYGVAYFTYQAPTNVYTNMHEVPFLEFSASANGDTSNIFDLRLIVLNQNNTQWTYYRIVNSTSYVVSPTLGWNISITVEAMNYYGAPLANNVIYVNYSNPIYLSAPPSSITTNSSGFAILNLSFVPGLSTAPIYINFRNISSITTISDRLDILYYNGTGDATHLFGGYISLNESYISHSTNFTVHMYNVTNQPAASEANESIPMAIVVSGTVDGQLVNLYDKNNSGWFFNSAWYFTGIGIYTPHANIATSGDFIGYASRTPNPYDDGLSTLDETGVVPALLHNGTLTEGLPLSMVTYRDLSFNIYAIPYGEVYLYISDPSWSFYQFNITGQQVFESQAIVKRAQHILIVNASTVPETTTGTPFPVQVTVYTENNTPSNNVTVKVYNNLESWRSHFKEVSGKTNSSGKITLSPNVTKDSLPTIENVFVKAISTLNYSLIERTQIFVVPKIPHLTMNVSRTVVTNGSSITVTGVLSDDHGPIFNKTVTLYINGGKIKGLKTDENGTVKFDVNITTVQEMNTISLWFDSSGYWPVCAEKEIWSVPPLIMKQLKYPLQINVGQSGNITVELHSIYGTPTVYIYIKYSTDIGYARYAMLRINGTDIYYFNTTYHWPGTIDFYLYINDSKGDNITTPVYSILVEQAVPELNSSVLIFAGLAIIAIAAILRRKK